MIFAAKMQTIPNMISFDFNPPGLRRALIKTSAPLFEIKVFFAQVTF
jgi:hypothetical protein